MHPVKSVCWAFYFIVRLVLVSSTKQHTWIFMVDEQLQAIKIFSILIIRFQICRKFLRRKFSELWNETRQVSRFPHNWLNYPGSAYACLSTGHNYASSSLLILISSRNFVRDGVIFVSCSFVQALVRFYEAFSVDSVTLFLNLSGNFHSWTYLITTEKNFLFFQFLNLLFQKINIFY